MNKKLSEQRITIAAIQIINSMNAGHEEMIRNYQPVDINDHTMMADPPERRVKLIRDLQVHKEVRSDELGNPDIDRLFLYNERTTGIVRKRGLDMGQRSVP